MARERTVDEKVGDWQRAHRMIAEELTPPALRQMMTTLTGVVPPEGTDDLDQLRSYIETVNSAMGIARVVFANDRAAGVVAAMLVQSGVSRPIIDTGDDA